MKLKNVEVGQIVVDQSGNEYKVTAIDRNNNRSPVELVCTKFVVDSSADFVFKFNKVGKKLWISLNGNCYHNDIFKPDVTVESLELKTDTKEVDLKTLCDKIQKLENRVAYLEKLTYSEDN